MGERVGEGASVGGQEGRSEKNDGRRRDVVRGYEWTFGWGVWKG